MDERSSRIVTAPRAFSRKEEHEGKGQAMSKYTSGGYETYRVTAPALCRMPAWSLCPPLDAMNTH